MGIRHIALIGSTSVVLLSISCRLAWADNVAQPPGPPAGQGQNAPHFNPYNLVLPHLEDKSPGGMVRGSDANALQGKPAADNFSDTKLHWSTIDSRPAVSYQLDKNEDVHLHFGRHGAVANFALHF